MVSWVMGYGKLKLWMHGPLEHSICERGLFSERHLRDEDGYDHAFRQQYLSTEHADTGDNGQEFDFAALLLLRKQSTRQ